MDAGQPAHASEQAKQDDEDKRGSCIAPPAYPPRRSWHDVRANLAEAERFHILTEEYMARRKHELADRCGGCWHHPPRCICSRVRPLALARRVRVAVLMYRREYGNAADSSKLLLMALPGSRLFVFGVRADEAALAAEMASSAHTVLLYPDEQARPITALPHLRDARDLLVLVLDGSWRQARAMRRWIAEQQGAGLQSVMLGGVAARAFTRPRPSEQRAATAEAVAQLLVELGEDRAHADALLAMVAANSAALRH